jgi:hypothetical protein
MFASKMEGINIGFDCNNLVIDFYNHFIIMYNASIYII